MRRPLLAGPLAILLVASGCKEAPPPEAATCDQIPQMALQGRVNDAATVLSDEEEVRLTQRLARYEARTRHPMVVATVASLNGATVEDFATCLGNRWGIGRKGENDGILILVAPNERRVRVATGTGIGKLLSDEKAKAVIDQMTPGFKSGDYAAGLTTGIEAIAAQTGDAS